MFITQNSHLPLLRILLSVMPLQDRFQQIQRFHHLAADLEFATWVSKNCVEHIVQEAKLLGFTIWTSIDHSSAFLYGATEQKNAEIQSVENWLREITQPACWGQIMTTSPGGQISLRKIFACDD